MRALTNTRGIFKQWTSNKYSGDESLLGCEAVLLGQKFVKFQRITVPSSLVISSPD